MMQGSDIQRNVWISSEIFALFFPFQVEVNFASRGLVFIADEQQQRALNIMFMCSAMSLK